MHKPHTEYQHWRYFILRKIYKENVFWVYGRVQQALVQLCGKSHVAPWPRCATTASLCELIQETVSSCDLFWLRDEIQLNTLSQDVFSFPGSRPASPSLAVWSLNRTASDRKLGKGLGIMLHCKFQTFKYLLIKTISDTHFTLYWSTVD